MGSRRLSRTNYIMRSHDMPPIGAAMVSIVLPTYNRAQFLPAAVASIANQAFTDWELVIVDDGSTDNTADVVRPFLATQNVRCVRQDNRGARSVSLGTAA